jgi:hypothetical protein
VFPCCSSWCCCFRITPFMRIMARGDRPSGGGADRRKRLLA